MQPALNPDRDSEDYVFLSRWSTAGTFKVERGDIISLKSPSNPEQHIIKRVVGLQGDIVSTKGYKKPYVRIPEHHFWVEGDNTGNSLDSNTFGSISLGLMQARAAYIVWPPARWQKLNTTVPPSRKPIFVGESNSRRY